nr:hypothetical protein [Amycolatopsis aidingensis]
MTSGAGSLCPGGGQAVAGEFVLQVVLELADRDQDVDQHGGGRVGGGQVDDAGQHAQFHAVGAAPFPDREDVRDVAAEPVLLRDGEPVAGPGRPASSSRWVWRWALFRPTTTAEPADPAPSAQPAKDSGTPAES